MKFDFLRNLFNRPYQREPEAPKIYVEGISLYPSRNRSYLDFNKLYVDIRHDNKSDPVELSRLMQFIFQELNDDGVRFSADQYKPPYSLSSSLLTSGETYRPNADTFIFPYTYQENKEFYDTVEQIVATWAAREHIILNGKFQTEPKKPDGLAP